MAVPPVCSWRTRTSAAHSNYSLSRVIRIGSKDFQQEVVAPTATASFHDGALFVVGMLLQQRQGEAIQPSKVLAHVRLSDARFVFAVDHIQTPMTAILDPPMTADRTRELLYAHPPAADVITRLDGFFTV